MKQLAFMFVTLLVGLFGGMVQPFYAIIPYYVFSILQPQYLWAWALPQDVRWSLLAAAVVLPALFLHGPRLLQRTRWNPVVMLLVIYSVLITISCISADNIDVSDHWFDVVIKIMLMSVVTVLVTDSLDKLRAMALVIAASLIYLAGHFNSLYFFDHRMDILNDGLGAYDNNGIGGLFILGLPFIYALGKDSRKWWAKIGWVAAGGVVVHGILLTYSRGAMTAALVGGAWLLWHHRPRFQTPVLVLLIVVSLSFMAGNEVRHRFLTIFDEQHDSSVQSRFESWNAAWDMVCDHPIMGVGLRNSNIYALAYGADHQGRTVHNTYLQIAADSGLPALGVYVALLGTSLAYLSRTRRKLERWESEHAAPKHGKTSTPAGELAPFNHHTMQKVRGARDLVLAIHAALLIFAVHSFFFSSEFFELQYLLLALAGITPGLVEEYLTRIEHAGEIAKPRPSPLGAMKRPSRVRNLGVVRGGATT